MLHQGTRATSTNLNQNENQLANSVLDFFIGEVNRLAIEGKIRQAIVRSRLACNIVVLLDDKNLILIAEPANGVARSQYLSEVGKVFSSSDMDAVARYDLGFSNYFYVMFPKDLFQKTPEQQQEIIRAIATAHVDNEVRRVITMNNLIQINPIFGPASYKLDENLVFVLMPFIDNLTTIYTNIIKPTVEDQKFNLICKRADDLKSTKPIIQDIWKSICEAKFIIADVTGFNSNVMYELGIAHTIGKDTILIYQKHAEETLKFPFDVAHIRRIEYEDTAFGGNKLKQELEQTILNLLTIRSI